LARGRKPEAWTELDKALAPLASVAPRSRNGKLWQARILRAEWCLASSDKAYWASCRPTELEGVRCDHWDRPGAHLAND